MGAGGSIDIGMPSTKCLTDHIIKCITPSYDGDLPDPYNKGNPDVIKQIQSFCFELWEKFTTRRNQPNFEHLIGDLEFIYGLNERDEDGNFSEKHKLADKSLDFAINIILQLIYKHSIMLDKDNRESWAIFSEFWNRLNDTFELIVITLNYGNEIEKAIELQNKGFVSVSNNNFSMRLDGSEFFKGIIEPQIIHLHGSIHFGQNWDIPGFIDNLENLQDQHYYDKPMSAYSLSNFMKWENVGSAEGNIGKSRPIIAGLRKMDKFNWSPFCYYLAILPRLLNEIQNLLIIGYGFGDPHINNWLLRIRDFGEIENRKIFMITKKDSWEETKEQNHVDFALNKQLESQNEAYEQNFIEIIKKMSFDCWCGGFNGFAKNDGVNKLIEYFK